MLPRLKTFLVAFALTACLSAAAFAESLPVPDTGWRLWPDTQAAWQKDAVYLPGEAQAAPVNPPTGGWQALTAAQGISVTLPSTVEQHYWGKFGLRPYQDNEYVYAGSDPQVQNGSYKGVSWWWRSLPIPASFAGKTVLLHIRGARQRAEVYLNQHLVGYSLIEETGFDCDLSRAIRPGQPNQLAIRITNPGGRLDWGDWVTYDWGGSSFFLSHGFGGLDRGLTLSATAPVYLSDAWALNMPQARTVQAHAVLHNTANQAVSLKVQALVIDPKTQAVLATKTIPVTIPAGADQAIQTNIACPKAQLWDLKTPALYTLRLTWAGPKKILDGTRDVSFGFRWFAPDGVGKDAVLRLNGRRIRMYSAISWGFWGLNGLWPTPALAEKEVRQAQRLGLNTLNFHRNIGKPEVLDVQDRLGLLRYMEPGGGQFAIGSHRPGDSGEATSFSEKYMEDKILGMIRDNRSHPSLVIYVVQNEAIFDLKNPRVFALLRRMHHEDPSRTIVLKSGIAPEGEAWMQPYDDAVHYDKGDGYSGWWDHHTVGYPDGVWQDGDYNSPDDFAYRSDTVKEVTDWGEMGGSGVLDNHALMVSQIKQMGGESYDLADHQEILGAYNAFLDRWNFRTAFPTAQALFQSIGSRQYEYWANIVENARLSEPNDYITISGWETTAIENHSGLVDNLRNFHGPPNILRERLASLLPVAKPRHSVVKVGETAALDLSLLNETGQAAADGPLRLTLTDPSGKATVLGRFPNPGFHKDQFVYPIQANVLTPPLTQEGVYRLDFGFAGKPGMRQTRELRAVAMRPLPPLRVGVVGSSDPVMTEMKALGLRAEPYQESRPYDVLVASAAGGNFYSTDNAIAKTDDPKLFQRQRFGKGDSMNFTLSGLPPGPARVTLLFAETFWDHPGARRFDIRINGQTVLHDFDIYAEAGGKNAALPKNFTTEAPLGTVTVQVGDVAVDNATLAGIKAEAGGKTAAVYFGEAAYTDKSGQVWLPYQSAGALTPGLLARVKAGLPLLVDTASDEAADADAKSLAEAGAFQYAGLVGRSRAPWMGCWFFVRPHPLYAGLPVSEAMHGDYQVGTNGANGLRVDGAGVQIVTAYGRDHDRILGASDFTAALGRGRIVFHCMPAMHPAMRSRWLANAFAFLTEKQAP